jgi:TldD protein
MTHDRRTFLKLGAAATLSALASPRPLLAQFGAGRPEPVPPIQDPRVKGLAQRAVDAARAAGAHYADVRLVHTRRRKFSASIYVGDAESMTVGVRALVNGYWGFSASPVWSPDEMARVAREAVRQAKLNSLGKPRSVNWAPAPAVADGQWVMPVKQDPFEVSIDEISDCLSGLRLYTDLRAAAVGLQVESLQQSAEFIVSEKAFASSDGSYLAQRAYRTHGQHDFAIIDRKVGRGASGSLVDYLSPAGMGWELFRDQPLREAIRRELDIAKSDIKLPIKPVDVGRYDAVLDAYTVAQIASATLGLATELDRAFGAEANATGTSYLNNPNEMLGTFKIGTPLLNVTANRNDVGSVATVKWDDDGVAPEPFTLVKQGVLSDFATTRENASWLKDGYGRSGVPIRSRGCSAGGDDYVFGGMFPPLTQTPNLVIVPGQASTDFDGLVAGVERGVAYWRLMINMDFQQLNGFAFGQTYEIRNGKKTARLNGGALMFRAPELWKSVTALAGPAAACRYGMQVEKGEPAQELFHSVTAVPVRVKDATMIDYLRKA